MGTQLMAQGRERITVRADADLYDAFTRYKIDQLRNPSRLTKVREQTIAHELLRCALIQKGYLASDNGQE